MLLNRESREYKVLNSALIRLYDVYNEVDSYPQYDLLKSIEAAVATVQKPQYAEVQKAFMNAIDALYYLDENERCYGHGGYDIDPDDYVLDLNYKFAFTEASGEALRNAEQALERAEEALDA